VFHPVSAPTDEDAAAEAEQVQRALARKPEAPGDEDGDAPANAEPLLAMRPGASDITDLAKRRSADADRGAPIATCARWTSSWTS
jgi:hypothetical protein